MAFIARVESWQLSDGGDGLASTVLDETLADAVTVSADMITPLELFESVHTYALHVYGISGTCVAELAEVPTEDPNRGRLIPEGTGHWFIVRPGDKLFITEYAP